MGTITARSVRRAINRLKPKSEREPGAPTLAFVTNFLKAQGVQQTLTGNRRSGNYVMVGTLLIGAFRSFTFRHPTKRANAARYATLTVRHPEAA